MKVDGYEEIQVYLSFTDIQRECLEAIWRAALRKSDEMLNASGVKPNLGVFLTDNGEIMMAGLPKTYITKTRVVKLTLIPMPDEHRPPSNAHWGLKILPIHDDYLP